MFTKLQARRLAQQCYQIEVREIGYSAQHMRLPGNFLCVDGGKDHHGIHASASGGLDRAQASSKIRQLAGSTSRIWADYQLDPQIGATIKSLDLIGDQGRAKGDIQKDIATECDNLWIVTTFQLLRVKLQ